MVWWITQSQCICLANDCWLVLCQGQIFPTEASPGRLANCFLFLSTFLVYTRYLLVLKGLHTIQHYSFSDQPSIWLNFTPCLNILISSSLNSPSLEAETMTTLKITQNILNYKVFCTCPIALETRQGNSNAHCGTYK